VGAKASNGCATRQIRTSGSMSGDGKRSGASHHDRARPRLSQRWVGYGGGAVILLGFQDYFLLIKGIGGSSFAVDVKMAIQPWVSLPPVEEQIELPELLAIGT
jgi:hypothetical protein